MDWSYIQNILFEMGKLVFLLNFVLLLVSVMVERKVSSIVISLLVLALASGIMSALTPLLYDISSRAGVVNKLAWYGGFALIDCIALYLLFKLHKLLKQNVSKVAHLVGGAFLLFTLLQSVRFFDRFIFDTDIFSVIYRNGIPALNLMLVLMIIVFWLDEVIARKVFTVEVKQ